MRFKPLSVFRHAILLLVLIWSSCGLAAGRPDIRVEGGGWGTAANRDIEAVLRSVADVLLVGGSAVPDEPVIVTHTDGAPIAIYRNQGAGAYRIMLHASDAHWHLYVYEFAHELCHVLSNYDSGPADVIRHNQWFEESLCETASLFALKTLAVRWQTTTPVSGLSGEGARLRRFFDLLMAEDHRQLPPGSDLATWVAEHEGALRRNPYRRRDNEVLATQLLPLFDTDGRQWEALHYLNLDAGDCDRGLAEYLQRWYQRAPDAQRGFVARLDASMLGDRRLPDAETTAGILKPAPRVRPAELSLR